MDLPVPERRTAHNAGKSTSSFDQKGQDHGEIDVSHKLNTSSNFTFSAIFTRNLPSSSKEYFWSTHEALGNLEPVEAQVMKEWLDFTQVSHGSLAKPDLILYLRTGITFLAQFFASKVKWSE